MNKGTSFLVAPLASTNAKINKHAQQTSDYLLSVNSRLLQKMNPFHELERKMSDRHSSASSRNDNQITSNKLTPSKLFRKKSGLEIKTEHLNQMLRENKPNLVIHNRQLKQPALKFQKKLNQNHFHNKTASVQVQKNLSKLLADEERFDHHVASNINSSKMQLSIPNYMFQETSLYDVTKPEYDERLS